MQQIEILKLIWKILDRRQKNKSFPFVFPNSLSLGEMIKWQVAFSGC